MKHNVQGQHKCNAFAESVITQIYSRTGSTQAACKVLSHAKLMYANLQPELMPGAGVDEAVVLITAMHRSNMPKFLLDDAVLFNAIVSDLFPGLDVPDHVGLPALTAAMHAHIAAHGATASNTLVALLKQTMSQDTWPVPPHRYHLLLSIPSMQFDPDARENGGMHSRNLHAAAKARELCLSVQL